MREKISRSAFKRVILLTMLVFSMFLFQSKSVHAAEGYTIKAYDVNIEVGEDNKFHITETIECNFTEQKHGIVREIPTRNTVRRTDGTLTHNKVTISNVDVNVPKKTYHENGNYCIRLGDADSYVFGDVIYTISYDYNLGKDPLPKADELYFNIIGTGWATTIENITFTIQMPKSFDSSPLGFSYGPYSTLNTKDVSYTVSGSTIRGSLPLLHAYEGLTVRCELPEGYFVYHKTLWDYLAMLLVGVPFVSLFYVFTLWNRFGRDDKIVESLQFYPPEGMNPIETKLFYDGSVSGMDVTSLLPYLAEKGYLAIHDDTDQNETFLSRMFNGNKNFHFEKLREYDGGNAMERRFFNGLFAYGNIADYDTLYDRFYRTTNSIAASMNKRTDEVFVNQNNRVLAYFLGCISYVLLLLKPALDAEAYHLIFIVPFTLAGAGLLTALFQYKKKIGYTILAVLVGGGALLITLPITYASLVYHINPIVFALGVISLLLTFIFARIMPRRPRRSAELAGMIFGFKRFLETAKKEQLEELVEQDPEYFYDVLPYTYVLGVSDKWIKKFESINLKQPDYYYGNYYDPYHFHHFMYSSMQSTQHQHVESSSGGSGGGGGGGGGFSGGGSGGGGGHSW